MEAHEFIQGHEHVLRVFGRWPDFHDGEVHRVVLDRTRRLPDGAYYPSVELIVRGWTMSSEVAEAGCYKLENDSLVHFLFEHVSGLELDGLNHQNVLYGLNLELSTEEAQSGSAVLSVELTHCFGLSGSFKARQASLISVHPYVGSTGG